MKLRSISAANGEGGAVAAYELFGCNGGGASGPPIAPGSPPMR